MEAQELDKDPEYAIRFDNLQRPETAYWLVDWIRGSGYTYTCSECKSTFSEKHKNCPKCNCLMWKEEYTGKAL